jgi:ribonuclease E
VDAPTEKADKAEKPAAKKTTAKKAPVAVPVFQAAPLESMPNKKKPAAKKSAASDKPAAKKAAAKKSAAAEEATTSDSDSVESGEERTGGNNRNRNRNRRGGKNKNRAKNSETGEATASDDTSTEDSVDESTESAEASAARKRSRKRTRDTADGESGSTRLDAKRNRRRDGRDAGRRRTPILSESEFLARRENVERVMVVRQQGIRTQIAVLEDGVVVEHYINQSSSGSLVGNVYLGRVQNVLPGMEAAFVDIGKGRNAVLYAGEVNWDAAGLDGQPKKIETALKSGDPILVQVTKDPVGQKGARLTSQISLPGRFLVYVPNNPMTGISRKLPDRERSRLKTILKAVVPEDGGVIVRTAAEGASEEELGRDVARLAAQWTDIEAKSKTASPPTMLYGEPDISIKVVRDIFNEDVKKLVVSGAEAWETVEQYVSYVAPDLADRLEKYVGTGDVFTEYRVDEQIAKALDRKVYLPSGGSLVIDRTEAMTVVDVNTGKFIGQGGNLEQTVTKNNLEAAEEIVRQLRLRDIGGIIVIDFIDMVLESNRDQVIRRLIECLGRDRTKHQVAEVTSLGLVQMTRKRIGAGLLEVFSDSCDHCQGRGAVINMDGHDAPKPPKNKGKKGIHDHSGDESTDSEPESADSV